MKMQLNICRAHGHVKLAHYSRRKFVGERHLGFLIRLVAEIPLVPLSGHLRHDNLIKYAYLLRALWNGLLSSVFLESEL